MTTQPQAEPLVVTQADRDAAALALEAIGSSPWHRTRARMTRAGEVDDHPFVQAFARHRTDAVSPLVECLDAAKAWIEQDDMPMGPAETLLHRALLAKIDAAIRQVRGQ